MFEVGVVGGEIAAGEELHAEGGEVTVGDVLEVGVGAVTILFVFAAFDFDWATAGERHAETAGERGGRDLGRGAELADESVVKKALGVGVGVVPVHETHPRADERGGVVTVVKFLLPDDGLKLEE